jgi:hypothetical protein
MMWGSPKLRQVLIADLTTVTGTVDVTAYGPSWKALGEKSAFKTTLVLGLVPFGVPNRRDK